MTTAASAAAAGVRARLLHRAPLLALALAAVAVVLLGLGPLGWRAGWWHYTVAFGTILPCAGYCGTAAVGIAVFATARAWRRGDRRGILFGIVAIIAGAASAYIPWGFEHLRRSVPPIDDITTDWTDPPAFAAVVAQREAENGNPSAYPGRVFAEQQRRAYPDVAPAWLDQPPPQAFAHALAAAKRLGWVIVAADSASGKIEATERSFWFGFTDDIALRVAAADAGSRVDVRSSSRHGRSDYGVNAARIRRFLATLRSD
jgi:uncharacterized protein (DUF1499 family)